MTIVYVLNLQVKEMFGKWMQRGKLEEHLQGWNTFAIIDENELLTLITLIGFKVIDSAPPSETVKTNMITNVKSNTLNIPGILCK